MSEYKWVSMGYRLTSTDDGRMKVEPFREEWPAPEKDGESEEAKP